MNKRPGAFIDACTILLYRRLDQIQVIRPFSSPFKGQPIIEIACDEQQLLSRDAAKCLISSAYHRWANENDGVRTLPVLVAARSWLTPFTPKSKRH